MPLFQVPPKFTCHPAELPHIFEVLLRNKEPAEDHPSHRRRNRRCCSRTFDDRPCKRRSAEMSVPTITIQATTLERPPRSHQRISGRTRSSFNRTGLARGTLLSPILTTGHRLLKGGIKFPKTSRRDQRDSTSSLQPTSRCLPNPLLEYRLLPSLSLVGQLLRQLLRPRNVHTKVLEGLLSNGTRKLLN